MKKILLFLILILFVFSPSSADVGVSSYGVGHGGAVAGPCAGISGSVTYLYNGDYTDDTDAACNSSQAKLDGTVQDATVSSDYVQITSSDDYLSHAVTASEIAAAGATVWFSLYFIDADTDTHLDTACGCEFENTSFDSDNFIYMTSTGDGDGAGKITFRHKGGGTSDSIATAANSIAVATWYRCGYSWIEDGSEPDHALMCTACGGGGTQDDCSGKGTWTGAIEETDELDTTPLETAINIVIFGELNSGASTTDDTRIADVYSHVGQFKAVDTF